MLPANLTQRGGSALTIQSGDQFDAIVFGERAPKRWMSGSNFFQRTPANQGGCPAETADAETMVQIATTPPLALALLVQRYIVCGLTFGAVKG